MRVTLHCGREGNARHNDRTATKFYLAPESGNLTWSWDAQIFSDAERHYYERFKDGLEATNKRYLEQRHPERVRKIEDLYTSSQTRPEEVILQIGSAKNAAEVGEKFASCVLDYVKRLMAWANAHGEPFQILDFAIHMDETSPHCHLRRVWQFRDDDGLLRPGQNQALREAGIPLPDPEKPEGRYNNRKMTFDRLARHLWQEVCRSHGFEIETDPRPERRRHKSVKDFKREQQEQREQLSQKEAWRRWEEERSR